jgi:hypothetical protein
MTIANDNKSKDKPLVPIGFTAFDDASLISAAHDKARGLGHAHAIVELVNRALVNPDLLESACKAISSDRRMGIHTYPNGWFGADQIYNSGNQAAMRALLNEMNSWDEVEQENMIAHWEGHHKRAELTKHLTETYGWQPLYHIEEK